ncbi:hypothetical protein NAP1_14433 [Erythrobacter sp. NAP1]|uniref:DUF4402 domain-containing protein n=1 Tax=Erythrobacter sp. NAP1 TaxID=237727 RepID=UPI000068757F|nr:DUF4402 domain-containing protein [Erythrobacter sp. NAP1]EAQ28804.1 hypothetical protein NAP1_14433 [Erythrobacter sp. NAP1]
MNFSPSALAAPTHIARFMAVIVLALCVLATPHVAQAQDVASTTAVVRIPGETRIEKLGDLNFGDILPGDSGGTITLDTASNVSTTGTVQSLGGDPVAAEFLITRQILADFPSYDGPQSGDTIELAHISLPGETMTLRDFTTDFNRPGFFGLPAYFFRTSFDFRVAGTLDVAADQEPGSYLGFFTVIIDYN